MKAIWLIARRELAAYLSSLRGYVIIAVVLLVDGLLFNTFALGADEKQLSSEVLGLFFNFSSGTTIVASVLISMRLIAEERQTGTLVLLTSSPLSDAEIVLGKWLSGVLFLGLLTLSTLYMPALVMVHGKVSAGHLFAGYLGLMLLGAATLAIGTLGSTLARTQVTAVIVSGSMVMVLLVFWLLAKNTGGGIAEVMGALALHGKHYYPFQNGLLHLRDVTYYVLLTYVMLTLSIRVLEARRWR